MYISSILFNAQFRWFELGIGIRQACHIPYNLRQTDDFSRFIVLRLVYGEGTSQARIEANIVWHHDINMNVFKKGRKAKDKENVDPLANDGASIAAKTSRSFKRKNKNMPEPKPEFNLAGALPDTNDFRTSLLMPGLSARFSMLKEQDDPNSMLGKASDDSVLFPKRASRMNLFSHNPLTDIAETESIRSIPKPFAHAERSMSFSEGGYASDDGGSVMSRSRPGEGNNMFGGRQKVYRIANGVEATGSGKGRHLYEDDVAPSPYQQYKSRSRDELDKLDSSEREIPSRQSEEADTVSSPLTAFSKNRGTQSSTNSGPSGRRTSTAATSVATCDSPIPRQNSGHGTSKLRTSDGFEATAVSRNPSSESRRAFNQVKETDKPPMPSPHVQQLSQPRSTANLSERYGARSPMFSTNAFRANSPPPIGQAVSSLDSEVHDGARGAAMASRRYQTSSPTNQVFDEDGDQVYSNNLQPNDRGKATAMGLFNRPRQQFDEQQFLQRQRQMHEDRMSPVPTQEEVSHLASSSNKRIDRTSDASKPAMTHRYSDRQSHDSHHTNDSASAPYVRSMRKLSSPEKKVNPPVVPAQKDVKARVESLIRRNNAELAAAEKTRSPPHDQQEFRDTNDHSERGSQSQSTFINRFDSSDDEAEEESEQHRPAPQVQRPKLPPQEIHPALRNGLHDFDFGEQVSPSLPKTHSESSIPTPLAVQPNLSPAKPKNSGDDSPTLGPNGLGLSGMIRTHLRNDSDRSSIYPPQSPVSQIPNHLSRTSREMSMVSTSNTINPPASVHSDPWEFDNAHQQRHRRSGANDQSIAGGVDEQRPDSLPATAPPTMSQKAQQILGHAAAQRLQGGSKAHRVLGEEAPQASHGPMRSPRSPRWPQETLPQQDPEPNSSNETVQSAQWHSESERVDHRGHQRNPSTETQKERQAFDDELAERRRKIQEGLRGIAERDRSQSPAPARVSNENYNQQYDRNGSQGFSGLRHKTSRGQMAAAEYSNKAMKMLGLNSGNNPAPQEYHQRQPPRHYNSSDNEYEEPPHERERYRRPQHRPPPAASQAYASNRRPPHEGRNSGRRTPGPSDGRTTPHANSSTEDFERARQRSATPNSQRSHGRDRAGSEAAERSKSRQRIHRDDEGYGPPRHEMKSTSSPSPPHARRRAPEDAHPNGYERAPSTTPGQGRQRSNSRPGPPQGYFDSRAPPTPVLSNGPMPSPMGPPPAHVIGAPSPALGPPSSAHAIGAPSPALGGPRPSPRPPVHNPMAGSHSAQPSPATSAFPTSPLPTVSSALATGPTTAGRSTPDLFGNGRSTPTIPAGPSANTTGTTSRPRRMTVNKNMISEPTFISSTSSVPLVGLPHSPKPRPGVMDLPPPVIPAMNPRRRVGTPTNENTPPLASPAPVSVSASASPQLAPNATFEGIFGGAGGPKTAGMAPPPKAQSRGNRLRKISSEGGGLASRARQEKVWAEREREDRLVGGNAGFNFGTRSDVSVNVGPKRGEVQEGGMF